MKSIHRVRARLADGTNRSYHYNRRGGLQFWSSNSDVEIGSAEYTEAYEAAMLADGAIKARRTAFISSVEAGRLPSDPALTRRIRILLYRARVRARQKNRKFTLVEADVRRLVVDQANCCAVSGLEFSWAAGNRAGDRNPYAPSIDRIDSLDGYVPNNIRLVLSAVNAGLAEWGDDVYRTICRAVVGVEGFEPPTSSSQNWRATRLRYTPTKNDSKTVL
jgi:hypothetical protein